MKRREFITLLGGAAVAWPIAAQAQQAERIRRIGVLMSLAEGDEEGQQWLAIFRRELRDLSWTDRRNLNIQYRWAAGNLETARVHAAELIALKPDVVLGPEHDRPNRAEGADQYHSACVCERNRPSWFRLGCELG